MHEKIAKLGVKKEKGYLYYLDDSGDVIRVSVGAQGRGASNPEPVAKLGLKKSDGYLYFIDEDGDVARTPSSS